MGITLVRPNLEMKTAALAYRQEHFSHGEKIINGSELFDQIESYETWLEQVTNNSNPDTVSPDWVLTDTFFAREDESGEIVGMIDLRHELNDFLKDFGHCGYSVRPMKRNRGYATEMLRQLLSIARDAGLEHLNLSVAADNPPSIRTIVKNGGIYRRSFTHQGESADIYQIVLVENS